MIANDEERAANYRALMKRALHIREPWREYTSIGHPWVMPPKGGSPTALRKLLFIYGDDTPINLDDEQ